MKVFLAGATGAIGKRLVPLLLEKGYEVFGTTRPRTKPPTWMRRASRRLCSTCSTRRLCRDLWPRCDRRS